MDGSNTRRIVLLGKTGVGKSCLANTIFGEAKFQVNNFNDSRGHCTQVASQSVNGKEIILIDMPGFFDPGRSDEDMKTEVVRCTTECAPGPHAFLIVLKVERFTVQEEDIVTQLFEYFSGDPLTHAALVFTHGDELQDGMKIQEFVSQSQGLSDLSKSCGGRCHVVDNKYWKSNQQDEYRSNRFQVTELLNTIETMVADNNGRHYTNDRLQEVERAIQQEEERIRQSSANLSREERRKEAKSHILKKLERKAVWPWTRGFMGIALLIFSAVSAVLIHSKYAKVLKEEQTVTSVLVETPVGDPASTIGKVVEGVTTPLKFIKNIIVWVLKRFKAL